MDYHSVYLDLTSRFPDIEIKENHPLAPYTTVNIGGPADIFIHTKTSDEFVVILKYLSDVSKFKHGRSESADEGMSTANFDTSEVIVLGNGSNILISDSGIRGIIIKNTSTEVKYLDNYQVSVTSGVQLPYLINDTVYHQLSGLEEFAYIPSTIGGAIAGNIHGFNKNNFDKFLVSVEVFNFQTGNIEIINKSDLQWDYDYSEFKTQPHLIILSAVLALTFGDSVASQAIVNQILLHKTAVQSPNSLGSVFKNPPSDSAGRIIDQELGLKGFRLGDTQVSPLHANFILNTGQATATDYYALIQKIQTEALEKLNINLEPEIKFLGKFN